MTGPQRRGFKILKKLQLEVKDQIQTNLMSKEDWKTHYSKLWFNPDIQEKGDEEMVKTTDYEKDITMEELDLVLKKAKNRKSPGTDNLNVELFKYGGGLLKNKLLQLLNDIWHNHQIPNRNYNQHTQERSKK
jgi:hypothetical protein